MILIKAIFNNKVTFLLLLTIVMGYGFDYIEWSRVPVTQLNGDKGFSMWWHSWIIMHYLIGYIFLSIRFIKMSDIDWDVLKSYLFYDVFSLFNYLYFGWPEPKEQIIIGFCLMVSIFVLLRLWKHLNS